MGERKVLNKYVPWDFDPSRLPKGKRAAGNVMNVRMMLPFSMQCLACGEFMGAGKKFNSRKEDCQGMNYLGIQIVRFIQKCPACGSKFSFRTDPQHADYQMEWGAKRLAENLLKEVDFGDGEEEKEEEDAMTALESRTLESRRQMDILDALDEIKSRNQRKEHLDNDQIVSLALRSKYNETDQGTTEEEEAEVKELFKKRKNLELSDSEDDQPTQPSEEGELTDLLHQAVQQKQDHESTPSVNIKIAKRPRENGEKKKKKKKKRKKKAAEDNSKLTSLLGYGSGSSSEDEGSAKRQKVQT